MPSLQHVSRVLRMKEDGASVLQYTPNALDKLLTGDARLEVRK